MMGRTQISITRRESPDASQPQDYPEQRQVGGNAHEAYGGSSSAAELLGKRREDESEGHITFLRFPISGRVDTRVMGIWELYILEPEWT